MLPDAEHDAHINFMSLDSIDPIEDTCSILCAVMMENMRVKCHAAFSIVLGHTFFTDTTCQSHIDAYSFSYISE